MRYLHPHRDEIEQVVHASPSINKAAIALGINRNRLRNFCHETGIIYCRPTRIADLTGQQFNNWLVLYLYDVSVPSWDNNDRLVRWMCKCLLCNNTYPVLANSLKWEHSKNCESCRLAQMSARYQHRRSRNKQVLSDSLWTRTRY